MAEITMPRLSDSMEEGVIATWLVADGDEVRRGQVIAEIETDKATMPFEAEASGVIRLLEPEGATLVVGAPIASIGGEVVKARPRRPDGVNASPIARRVALAFGVELGSLAGSGPHGRVLKADVIAASDSPAPAEPRKESAAGARGTVEVIEPTRLQQTIARRMAESKATQPDFSVSLDVDMGALLELREQLRDLWSMPLTINDFIVRAAALTLRAHPRLNGTFRDDRFALHGRVNVGVAVATADGLVVPTVFDADRLPLEAIGTEVRRLAAAVRAGTVAPADLDGGTFTVSNLGMYGVSRFSGVINPPQAAILCVGAVEERPVVRDGQIAARPAATLTLVSDHRIVYGADAARFLSDLGRAIEQPLRTLAATAKPPERVPQ
jgi:pyruvate dehydrogenase E2 component (dihydrolipoamide acetyltransferase)